MDLIVRGMCCLIPGEKFRKNSSVTRLVDRFLEHARVFVFCNDGHPEMYMASADWMNRNLNRRIELGFPVYDENIKTELKKMLEIQLQDNSKARILDPELSNKYARRNNTDKKYRAQEDYYNYIK